MVHNCACGGRLRRTDIASTVVGGMTYYYDTDPVKANWACLKCGRVYTQRKRQPKKPRGRL
jgi:hypothetical protein